MGFPKHFAASTAPTVTSPLESSSSKRKYVDDYLTHAEQGITATKAPRRGSVSDANPSSPSQLATRIITSDQQSAAKVDDGSTAESRQPSPSSSNDSSDKAKAMPLFRSKPPSDSASFDRTELVGAFALASLSKGGGSSGSGSFSASFSTAEPTPSAAASSTDNKSANRLTKPVPVYADQRPGGFLPVSPPGQVDSPASTSVRTPTEAVPGLEAHMAQYPHAPPPHYHHPYPYYANGYYYGMPPMPTPPQATVGGYPAFPPPPPLPQAQAGLPLATITIPTAARAQPTTT